MHRTIRRNLAEAAEAMPADEYAFRPTPDVRTFAQLIGHNINSNVFFCSQVTHETYPPSGQLRAQVSDKATLINHQGCRGS